MLVLSRHRDEEIVIGDEIVITVVDIRGDKTRLRVAAPLEITVHRLEVYQAILRESRTEQLEAPTGEPSQLVSRGGRQQQPSGRNGGTNAGHIGGLVLNRHRDETIIIGDDIFVTVVDIRGDKVRLGIEAPKDVTVHRREVYEAIQNQARSAEHGAKVGGHDS